MFLYWANGLNKLPTLVSGGTRFHSAGPCPFDSIMDIGTTLFCYASFSLKATDAGFNIWGLVISHYD